MLKISEWNDTEPGEGGLPYAGRAIFKGIIFQHKFLNWVLKLIRNSKPGYDYFQEEKIYVFRLFVIP